MPGHIRKRSRGDGSTVYQARYPDPARGGTAKIERTFRTKREADAWLTASGAAVLDGSHVDPRLADRPWREVAEAWGTTWVDLEPKTKAGYESILGHHLLPYWGRRKVGSITHEAVQRWVATLIASGLAPGTVRGVYSVFRNAMNAGVRLGLVRTNPCVEIRVPRVPRRDRVILTAAEVATLADAMPAHYRALVYTAAYTGLRAGELAGLRRRNLDLLHARLTVAEALKEVRGHLLFGPPKTHERRTVSLPAFLVRMLEEHLATHTRGGTSPDALVFTTVSGKPIRHNLFYKRYFKPAVVGRPAREARPAVPGRRAVRARPAVPGVLPAEKAAFRFHDLRHTCASLLIAAGANPKAIQVRLGHSSIQITMDVYGHLFPDADDRLADVLDATHAAASSPPDNVVTLGTKPIAPSGRPDMVRRHA